MKHKLRMTLIAGAIGALLAAPSWAASDTPGAATGAATEPGQSTGTEAPAAMGTEMPGADAGTPGATAEAHTSDNPLYARTADDLSGMEVMDLSGERVGTVERVTLGPDRQSAHAVVSVGGFLGMGARDVIISLDQLTLEGDDLLRLSSTREQVEALPEFSDAQQDQYVELSGDRPIGESITEFSAFEPGQDPMSPGAAPGTPQPGSPGEAPGMSHPAIDTPGAGPGTPETGIETPGAAPGAPQTSR